MSTQDATLKASEVLSPDADSMRIHVCGGAYQFDSEMCNAEQAWIVGAIGSLVAFHLKRYTPIPTRLLLRSLKFNEALVRGSTGYYDGGRNLSKPGSATIAIERQEIVDYEHDFETELIRGFEPFQHDKISPVTMHKIESDRKRLRELYTSSSHIPLLFVLTKAQNTRFALSKLVDRLNNDSTIVIIQNGMGTVEEICDHFYRDPKSRPNFIIGTTSHGAYVKSRGSTLHTVWSGIGELHFGIFPSLKVSEELTTLFEGKSNPILDDSDTPLSVHRHLPKTEVTESLHNAITSLLACKPLNPSWLSLPKLLTKQQQKLVVNAVINPLTALLDVPNGTIFGSQNTESITESVCREASEVFARQEGLDSSKDFPAEHPLSVEALKSLVYKLMRTTSNNISSTLADVRGDRADCEMQVYLSI